MREAICVRLVPHNNSHLKHVYFRAMRCRPLVTLFSTKMMPNVQVFDSTLVRVNKVSVAQEKDVATC